MYMSLLLIWFYAGRSSATKYALYTPLKFSRVRINPNPYYKVCIFIFFLFFFLLFIFFNKKPKSFVCFTN